MTDTSRPFRFLLLLLAAADANVYTMRACMYALTCPRRDSIRSKGAKLDTAELQHATSRAAATAILD